MRVMRIGHMGMAMPHRTVLVNMAVQPFRHGFMGVQMVAVVMPVRVFMPHGFVLVFMCMAFGQVQPDAGHHQAAAQRHQACG